MATFEPASAVTTNVRRLGPGYRVTVPLGVTRPLEAALRKASTPTELLVLLGRHALATRLPPALTLRQLTEAASHQAALRRHPYVSPDHVVLAAAREVGDSRMVDSLAAHLDANPVATRRWWRPLGRYSALRPRGQRLLDDQQRAAHEREKRQPCTCRKPHPPWLRPMYRGCRGLGSSCWRWPSQGVFAAA
jgi:hypothetical protein